MKTVFILLTKYEDISSKLFNLFTFTKYTHAAIGLEDEEDHFFSFVTNNGFYLERPLRSKNPEKQARECALYELKVTNGTYELIKGKIDLFNEEAGKYHYSFLGVLLCILRISLQRKNHYFCSEFVSELLTMSGAIRTQKKPNLFLPDDFRNISELKLCFLGTIGELAEACIRRSCSCTDGRYLFCWENQ